MRITSLLRSRRLPPITVVLSILWLVAIAVLALGTWGGRSFLFVPEDAKVRINNRIQSAYKLGPGEVAWFGVDASGYDLLARCINYARNSLAVGFASTAIGLTVGGTLGILAGYFRGWVDRVVSIIVDCLMSIPALVLAILIVSRLKDVRENYSWLSWASPLWQVILTLSVLAIAPLARIVRAQTMALREREYVAAARSLGATGRRVVFREILPNLIPTMVTVAFTGLGILIAAEGALSFLGVGIGESWGYLIQANRNKLQKAWWATVFPCAMLFVTVMAVNLVGDRLSRRFDIRESSV